MPAHRQALTLAVINNYMRVLKNIKNLLSKKIEMTYDIYCYKSTLFAADLNEAQKVPLMKDQKSDSVTNGDKFKIIMALRKFNPKIDSCFMPGYNNLKINTIINDTHIVLNQLSIAVPKGVTPLSICCYLHH